MANQLYISGSYRTGSTLLSRIIDAHPDVRIMFDLVHFMRFIYCKYDPLYQHRKDAIENVKNRLLKRAQINIDTNKIEKKWMDSKKDYACLYTIIMEDIIGDTRKYRYWGEKTNVCWSGAEGFLKMFPHGKVLHIVRDPRDILTSFKLFTYEKDLLYLDACYNALGSMKYALNKVNIFPTRSYKIIRYEDLVSNPVNEVREICKFMDLEFKNEMMDPECYKDNNGMKWDFNVVTQKSAKVINNKSIGVWRRKLSIEEIAFVQMICGKIMNEFGYKLETININKAQENILNRYKNYIPLKDRYYLWKNSGDGFEGFPNEKVNQKLEKKHKG